MEGLEYQKPLDWENDVFLPLLEGEKEQGWEPVVEAKGWGANENSHRKWREYSFITQFGAEKRRWELFKVLDLSLFQNMLIGPYQGWHNLFNNSQIPNNERTFEKILKVRTKIDPKVQGIMDSLPEKTQLICGRLPNGQIVLLEGSHRTEAIVRLIQAGRISELENTNIFIAMTELVEEDRAVLNRMLELGTDNPQPKHCDSTPNS